MTSSTGKRGFRSALGRGLLSAIVCLMPTACVSETGEGAPPRARTGQASRSMSCRSLDRLVASVRRGYVPGRSPVISLIPRRPNYIGAASMPPHSGPWGYLVRVPLVLFGPGVVASAGEVEDPATMADVAPTVAALAGYDFDTRDGRPLRPAIAAGGRIPRLIVTLVWDGAGINVLESHGRSWPYLKRISSRGTSFTRMSVGSSPSNTPPVHTTLGTGVFPRRHGIPHVKMSTRSGRYVDPFESLDGSRIRVPTLADLYDRAHGNRPLVGVVGTVAWHLGMIGHGAAFDDGDRDTAVLLNALGEQYGDRDVYLVPEVVAPGELRDEAMRLDRRDGRTDGHWDGADLTDRSVRYDSPAFVRYQQKMLENTIRRLGFGADRTTDLLFVNFKQGDSAGHRWGMNSEQVANNIAAMDAALRRLVGFLNRAIGRARWAVVITADHGQTPYPSESGAWPIRAREVRSDIDAVFADEASLIERVTTAGVVVNRKRAKAAGVGLDRIADFIAGYRVSDNVVEGDSLPDAWKGRGDERLFDAVLVRGKLAAHSC